MCHFLNVKWISSFNCPPTLLGIIIVSFIEDETEAQRVTQLVSSRGDPETGSPSLSLFLHHFIALLQKALMALTGVE